MWHGTIVRRALPYRPRHTRAPAACASPTLEWYPAAGQPLSRFTADRYECMRDSTAAVGPAPSPSYNYGRTNGAAQAWNQGFANGQAQAQVRNYHAQQEELFNACMAARHWQLRAK